MRLALVGIACCLASAEAAAQVAAELPLDVETVVSGGYWQLADSTSGQFRVVIRTGGFDHLVSTMQIDWIREQSEATDAQVVASTDVPDVAAGGVLLHDPRLERDGLDWVLVVDATNTHCDPTPTTRWRVALGAPGTVSVLSHSAVRAGCD